MVSGKEKGQAMAEFALIMPALILLLFGMTFAAFYAFRSASTDWGVFITGVASGSYSTLQQSTPVRMFCGLILRIESMQGRAVLDRCDPLSAWRIRATGYSAFN